MAIPPEQYDRWQDRFVRDFFEKSQPNYLLNATPGAGKTKAAAKVARRALDGGRIDRVIFVVPRVALRKQTADGFSTCGVDIRPFWKSGDAWPSDAHGVAVTYQTLASGGAQLFRKFTGDGRTLVVLDEPHHCDDQASWGIAVQEAFGPAVHRLLITGTPWRHTGTPMPWINYVDGLAQADLAYGYSEALEDGIVRILNFPLRGGRMEWAFDDELRSAEIEDDSLSDQDGRHALRTAIDPEGEWVGQTIEEAHERLLELRKDDPTAGGNFQAYDTWAAEKVATRLRRIAGDNAVEVVTSRQEEEEDPGRRIDRYKNGTIPWLVSCDMVTEGIDIPRLRVLVYAKRQLTHTSFRQAAGRVVRRTDDDHDHAYVFIPNHPVLNRFAREIEEEVKDVTLREVDDILREIDAGDDGNGSRLFSAISSEALDQGVIGRAGEVFSEEEWRFAERVKLQDEHTAKLPTDTVVILLRNGSLVPHEEPKPAPEKPVYERADALRRENNKLVKVVALRFELDFAYVGKSANKMVGVETISQASITQLEDRLRFLSRWMEDAGEPLSIDR